MKSVGREERRRIRPLANAEERATGCTTSQSKSTPAPIMCRIGAATLQSHLLEDGGRETHDPAQKNQSEGTRA